VIIDRVRDNKTTLYLKNANKTLNFHFQGKEITKMGLLWCSCFPWEENWREVHTAATVLATVKHRVFLARKLRGPMSGLPGDVMFWFEG